MNQAVASWGDAVVALVTFSPAEVSRAHADTLGLSFPVLVDADRSTYRAFGLDRAKMRRVWGLRAARRYLEILRRPEHPPLHRPTEDTRQLGGDFVIDRDGRLAWGHWATGPDDRPTLDDIRAALR